MSALLANFWAYPFPENSKVKLEMTFWEKNSQSQSSILQNLHWQSSNSGPAGEIGQPTSADFVVSNSDFDNFLLKKSSLPKNWKFFSLQFDPISFKPILSPPDNSHAKLELAHVCHNYLLFRIPKKNYYPF